MRNVWIGTSGWVYKQWAGNFYPKGWPKKDELGFYVRHFPTVEINATFYRLPSLSMVRGWRERSPDGFLFAVKGSRFLTHIKRLRDTGQGLRRYFSRLKPLGDRTGPILWQLPPTLPKTPETRARLATFLAKLPRRYQHAVEFRHPSWVERDTFTLLRKHHAAHVWVSSQAMPPDKTITGPFVYLRFHGLKDGAYHDYTDEELAPWAKALAAAARRGLPSYVYFNNDLNTRAPLNAVALMTMLERTAVQPLVAEPVESLPDIKPPKRGAETWPAWNRPAAAAPVTAAARPVLRPAGRPTFARATPPAPAAARSKGPAGSRAQARPPSASARRQAR